ncbi:putative lipid transport family protein [Blattamonas nauphoetae]|uniref:Lipid transport family protein n=1 Tax=Blattamonas nauphoetae TaxID=2049346 RepID=A0ABQ9XS30_9EUKA|nr:putative lipid transport family protein [Blattamonas nauphoetae]
MLIALIATVFSAKLNYEVGKVYEYRYNSLTNINAENERGLIKTQGFQTTGQLSFHCMGFSGKIYVFKMTAKDVHIYNNQNGVRTKIDEKVDKFDVIFARPLVFALSKEGKITGMTVDKADTEDIINIKAAMAETLTTSTASTSNGGSELVCDTQGRHYAHSDESSQAAGDVVETYYTHSDFLNFRDRSADTSAIQMEGKTKTVLRAGVAFNVKSNIVYDHAGAKGTPTGDIEEGNVNFMTEGSSETSLLRVTSLDTFYDIGLLWSFQEFFKRFFPGYQEVSFYNPSYYNDRDFYAGEVDFTEIDRAGSAGEVTCPSALNLCKGYEASYSAGNTSFGITAHAQIMAGTNKGCDNDARNYFAGAETTVDLFILGKKYAALEAHIEYGYMYGSASRNNIEVNIFDKNVYRKTFPDMPCVRKSIPLANIKKSFPFKYTVFVMSLPVTFEVGVELGFSASVPYKYCLTDMSAEIGITPTASVAAFAQASASVAIIKGGIKFTADVTETLDPIAWISGGKCQVGIKAVSHTSPLSCEFYGFYQTRQLRNPLKWNDQKKASFWKWSSKAVDYTLLDFSWSMKV